MKITIDGVIVEGVVNFEAPKSDIGSIAGFKYPISGSGTIEGIKISKKFMEMLEIEKEIMENEKYFEATFFKYLNIMNRTKKKRTRKKYNDKINYLVVEYL